MKKKISLLFVIIGCAIITALIIGCPSNIQPENFGLYTVQGTVTHNGEGVEDILIEVMKEKLPENNANMIIQFSSDKNCIALSAHGRGDVTGDTTNDSTSSSDDENPVLGSCRTAADGTFSLTFKVYIPEDQTSDTDEIFYLYLSDDNDDISAPPKEVNFQSIDEMEGNPYGSYHKKSKKIQDINITI